MDWVITLVVDRGGYELYVEKISKGYSEWGDPKMELIDKYEKPRKLN